MTEYTKLVELYDVIADYIDGILVTDNDEYIDDLTSFLSNRFHVFGNDIDPIEMFTTNYPHIIRDAKNMSPSEIKSVYNELYSVFQVVHDIWINIWDEQCKSFNPTKDYTIDELKDLARYCGLTGYSKKNKNELIDLLNKYLQQTIR